MLRRTLIKINKNKSKNNKKVIHTQKKNTLIHPTKTGGSALEHFFQKYYPNQVKCEKHGKVCAKFDNPVICIREPIDRFISIYNYWKNGAKSGKFMRPKDWNPKVSNIHDFINKFRNCKEQLPLYTQFTFPEHFKPQSHWIDEDSYSKAVVILYTKDLNKKISKLLKCLGLKDRKIKISRVNESIRDSKTELTEEEIKWIKEIFKKDFELWNKLHIYPQLFKAVI